MTRRTPARPRSIERADEGQPGTALVVAGGELEAEHPALAGVGHADRDERRHRADPARLADLEVSRVEPQVRIALVGQRPGAEGLDLGVQAWAAGGESGARPS